MFEINIVLMSNYIIMPSKRKNNPAYIPTKTSVKGHSRTVYKRKKFHISNFTKKSNKKKRGGSTHSYGLWDPNTPSLVRASLLKKRGKSVGLAKGMGEILWEAGKQQARSMWDLAKKRQKEHAERIMRRYYYS